MEKIKMYILVKESAPVDKAMVSVAHASLAGYLKWKDDEVVKAWVEGIFYKVVCKVNDKEFELAKRVEDGLAITESSLDNQEVAMVFKPRIEEEWPKGFRHYRLYK